MISLTPKKQQKQVAGKTLKKFIDKECNPKKARFPQKIPGNKLQKKHFTKMQKHVGLASTKNQPNKMGLTWQYVLRLPSLHRSFQPHTPQSPLPTCHPYSITHTTQHTTHSPSQLYTQNSLNTHHKLLVHIPPYSASSINATSWSHSTPQTLTSTSNSTTTSTCTIVVGTWKAPCTKLWLLVKIVKISGVYKSAMAQVTCTMEYGICTLGKTYCCPRIQIPYN